MSLYIKALKSLSAIDRTIIQLRFLTDEPKTQKEVAKLLGMHPRLLRKREKRAVEDMRKQLESSSM